MIVFIIKAVTVIRLYLFFTVLLPFLLPVIIKLMLFKTFMRLLPSFGVQ